jgi:hypothetical protein
LMIRFTTRPLNQSAGFVNKDQRKPEKNFQTRAGASFQTV